MIPIVILAAIVSNIFVAKFQKQILDLYSKAGVIAEESISSVRTVTAFGGQTKLASLYSKELGGARNAGIRKSIAQGLGVGIMFMFIYFAYSLSFYYGSVLLVQNLIDSGTVVNVFFAVLIGAFAMVCSENIKSAEVARYLSKH